MIPPMQLLETIRVGLGSDAHLREEEDMSSLSYVTLMAGSTLAVWGTAAAVHHLAKPAPKPSAPDAERAEEAALIAEGNAGESAVESTTGVLGISTLSILFSIPALLGSWCWPIVLSALLGGVAELVSPKARAIGHAIFWGLNLGIFTTLGGYFAMRTPVARKHEESEAARWAPLAVIVLGACLVMVDLTRHVLLDLELAGEELAMYNRTGLSFVGKVGLVCTWVGVFLLAAGIAWFTDLPGKLLKNFNFNFVKES